MKRKILTALALVAGLAGTAHASEPFQFGIGMCEYGWSERSDSLLVGSKMSPTAPEDVLKSQEEYCKSKDNVLAVTKAHDKYVVSEREQEQEQEEREQEQRDYQNSPEGRRAQAARDAAMAEVTDTYQACVLGASDDTRAYVNLLNKYRSNSRMLNTLRKAQYYGYNITRTERDCGDYMRRY